LIHQHQYMDADQLYDDGVDSSSDAFSLSIGALEGWLSSSPEASADRLRSLASVCSPRDLLVALLSESSRAEPSVKRGIALCEGLCACLFALESRSSRHSAMDRHCESALRAVTESLHRLTHLREAELLDECRLEDLIAMSAMAAALCAFVCTAVEGGDLRPRARRAALGVAVKVAETSLLALGSPLSWRDDTMAQDAALRLEAVVTFVLRIVGVDADVFFAAQLKQCGRNQSDASTDEQEAGDINFDMTPRDTGILILFSEITAWTRRAIVGSNASDSDHLRRARESAATKCLYKAALGLLPLAGAPLCADVVSSHVRAKRLLVLISPLARESAQAVARGGRIDLQGASDALHDPVITSANKLCVSIVHAIQQSLAATPAGTHIDLHSSSAAVDTAVDAPDLTLLESLMIMAAQSSAEEAARVARGAVISVFQSLRPSRRGLLYASLATDCPYVGGRAFLYAEAAKDARTGGLHAEAALRVWHAGLAARLREGLSGAGAGGAAEAAALVSFLASESPAAVAKKRSTLEYLSDRASSDASLAALCRSLLARAVARSEPLTPIAVDEMVAARDGIIIPLMKVAVCVGVPLLEASLSLVIEAIDDYKTRIIL
jgi:hypothetical protein